MEYRSALPTLVVAADVPVAADALALADQLTGLPVWLKVGAELFTAEGPPLVCQLLNRHFSVFLDLKYHDIPHTVYRAVTAANRLGVQMLTVHAGGGMAMCRAAMAGKAEALDRGLCGSGSLVMGITVLTSDSGDARTLGSLVLERAQMAKECGLDGIVCSGWEVAEVKKICGRDFLCLCPGIRFPAADGRLAGDDQARICTPGQAAGQGADFIVMGRPVLQAPDRTQAVWTALEDMRATSVCE